MMSANEPQAGVETALNHAMHLLARDPALAQEQVRQILCVSPGFAPARLVLGMAYNAQGNFIQAVAELRPLAVEQPDAPAVHMETGVALAGLGRHEEAIAALRRAALLQPALPGVWLRLATLLRSSNDPLAEHAFLKHADNSLHDPQLMAAGDALAGGRLPEAETLLRDRLGALPDDVSALRMLAELAARVGRNEQALALLERCLQLAPGFRAARHNYALLLDRSSRHEEALVEIENLLESEPDNGHLLNLKAVVLGKLGQYRDAINLYESILAVRPRDPRVWMSLGHALKTEGKTDRAIIAYRRAIEINPGFGGAWWSLANLKTVRFDTADISAMQEQLRRSDLDDDQRLHVRFALGKALEDIGEYEASFACYAEGNAIRRSQLPYSAAQNTQRRRHAQVAYTREFFAERSGSGCPDPAPIFVLGMPRAGSTLIEQILSSHPKVEATMELPDIVGLVRDLRAQVPDPETTSYHDLLASIEPARFRELGERYLQSTRVQRKLGRPFFIDKMPNNFAHVGLIHLILPQAKIIDVRRHPLACCLSNFKQHFARGQAFSYDLGDMGRYYRDYVGLMAHFDHVLPGRVHRVIYEDLVGDTEGQVRVLLAHCGLDFDEHCLRFFENDRPVRTASSEQVRQPIYRQGMDHWQHYEAWLGPLKLALGPVLESYPLVPDDPL
jgi:tetratricopeptide (TPR) repeat protein